MSDITTNRPARPVDFDLVARNRRARAVLQRRRAVARQRLALRARTRAI